MIYLATYVVIIFTCQLVIILQNGPLWWIFILWGGLLFLILLKHYFFYLPQDHPHFIRKKKFYFMIVVALLFLCISSIYLNWFLSKQGSPIIQPMLLEVHLLEEGERITTEVAGRIASPLDKDGNRIRFHLDVEQIGEASFSQKERVILSYYAQTVEQLEAFYPLQVGDTWHGSVEWRKPDRARNPGAFDYQQYLAYQQIYFLGNIVENSWGWEANLNKLSPMVQLQSFRSVWMEQVDRIFSVDTAPIVKALTIGYREDLDHDLQRLYQQFGIIHLLAISGLHVGIIIWGLYRILLLVQLTREKALFILLLFIPLYIVISGAQPSVVRAGLMAMLAVLAIRFHWWKHSLLGLYLVYLITLLYNPYQIFHIGYQLSFLVTFALITVYPILSRTLILSKKDSINRYIAVAITAQIASLPVVLFHFYQISPISLLLNLVLVPLYSFFFIPAAFFIIIISFILPSFIELIIFTYEWSMNVVHQLLYYLYRFPRSILFTGKPAMWWLLLYSFTCVIAFIFMERKKNELALLCILTLPMLVIIQISLPLMDKNAHIMLLDVGQGEAIVIELPYRKEVMMIDLGGNVSFAQEDWMRRRKEFEVGRDIIMPYLRYRGINRLDKVIISHGHYDHYGGIEGLLGQIEMKGVYRGPIMPQSPVEREWLSRIVEHNIPIYTLMEGDHWGNEDYYFHLLFPPRRDTLQTTTNQLHDYNLVLWNKIYQTSFLWTGDVEERGELYIAGNYPQLQADVLKVAHHGSVTSSSDAWLDHIDVQYALISVGRNNRYGHPHLEVVQRLEGRELQIWRTDLHGGIGLIVTPYELQIVPTLQGQSN